MTQTHVIWIFIFLLLGLGLMLAVILAVAFYIKRTLSSLSRSRFSGGNSKIINLCVGVLTQIFQGARSADESRFQFRSAILRPTEQRLFLLLVKALPEHYVFGQVAYSQILEATGGSYKENFRLMGTMKQKVADFIVFGSGFNMVAVIELDDPTHDSKKDRDAKRDEVINRAGLKTVRWDVRDMPDLEKIRHDVLGPNAPH